MDTDAAVAETHISILFFVGDRVYKLKKPLRMSFLDFTDRAERQRLCHREVELNRRLAPDVYLGVADITGPDGELCDHLVVMRRMPPDRRLSRMVTGSGGAGDAAGDGALDACLDGVAEVLARFHADAERSSEISTLGHPVEVRRRWDDNLDAVRAAGSALLDPEQLAAVADLAHRYIGGRAPLFRARIRAGRIVDGHGDVLADDVYCLPDGPRILDCIEFSERFRWLDGIDDAAFLAMDLESLGAGEAARRFLASYRRAAADEAPPSLVHHYVAYRALVRTKVACLRAGQGGGDHDEAAARARRLLALCHRHLAAGQVPLVAVGGLPGTGKSTLARALAARLGWPVLHSDQVRKELAGLPPDQPVPAGFRQGLYAPDRTAATYAELLRRAEHHLQLGVPAILDASWTDPVWRAASSKAAAAAGSPLVALWCAAPEDLAVARITARAEAGGDPSDATPAVAAAMASTSSPWDEAVSVDTSGGVEAAVEAALSALGPVATL